MARVESVDPTNPLLPEYMKRKIETKVLELMQFGTTVCVSCEAVHHVQGGFMQMLDTYIVERMGRQAIDFAAKWYCPAELKKEIRHPANWLEAVKERFAPNWAISRWPVQYTVFKVYEMVPEESWPKHSGHRRNVFISQGCN